MKLTAYGTAAPKGSARGFARRRRDGTTAVTIVADNRSTLQAWTAVVSAEAHAALDRQPGAPAAEVAYYDEGPLRIRATFYLQRPKSRRKADRHPDRKPDIDKLARAALDALTGVWFADDAQICELELAKRYAEPGERPRLEIEATPLEEHEEQRP